MAARIGAETRAPWLGTGFSWCDTSEIHDQVSLICLTFLSYFYPYLLLIFLVLPRSGVVSRVAPLDDDVSLVVQVGAPLARRQLALGVQAEKLISTEPMAARRRGLHFTGGRIQFSNGDVINTHIHTVHEDCTNVPTFSGGCFPWVSRQKLLATFRNSPHSLFGGSGGYLSNTS